MGLIKQGRDRGWLKRPISEFPQWAALNSCSFTSVDCTPAGQNRGAGLFATRHLKGGEEGPLLSVPRELVISAETVKDVARSDKDLRVVLESLGEFGRTTRGAILTFLLYQATVASVRSTGEKLGSLTPFVDYVKFLPDELLPTLWTSDEAALLDGTSLQPALAAKMKSLNREFGQLENATKDIPWCQTYWWSRDQHVMLDDWIAVDAMYRSRALEFPGIGDAMVPCLDMANHASGNATAALYETDSEGNAILLLRDGCELKDGEEVTITYGDNKGACEMLFSYGFIEDSMTNAREMFVGIDMPDDDPLGQAKSFVAECAPRVKFFLDADGKFKWESEYIYLVNVNEEDGLDFKVARTMDGQQELQMFWHDDHVKDTAAFISALGKDAIYPIIKLRSVHMLLGLASDKNEAMKGLDERMAQLGLGGGSGVRERCRVLAKRLRDLEMALWEKAVEGLQEEMGVLMQDEKVQEYLAKQQEEAEEEEDFS